MDFSIDPAVIATAESRTLILDRMLEIVQSGNKSGVSSKSGHFISPNIFVGATAQDVLYTIRFQAVQGLITLNIEYMHLEEDKPALFNYEVRLILKNPELAGSVFSRLSFILCICHLSPPSRHFETLKWASGEWLQEVVRSSCLRLNAGPNWMSISRLQVGPLLCPGVILSYHIETVGSVARSWEDVRPSACRSLVK